MNGLKVASVMLFSYAVLLAVNAITYWSWSGDASELPGFALRFVGVNLVALGLWRSQRWAWQLGIVMSTFFGIAGVLSVATIFMTDLLVERPYPLVDSFVITVSAALLVGAVVVLLLPKTRKSLVER